MGAVGRDSLQGRSWARKLEWRAGRRGRGPRKAADAHCSNRVHSFSWMHIPPFAVHPVTFSRNFKWFRACGFCCCSLIVFMSECVHGDPYTVIPASLECIVSRVHNCNFVLRQELYKKELHALFRFLTFKWLGFCCFIFGFLIFQLTLFYFTLI